MRCFTADARHQLVSEARVKEHKSLESKTKTALARATAAAAEHASTQLPLEVSNPAQLRDLAVSAARVFGWGEGGTTVHAKNALIVTQEQLEQIRQLREPTVYEAPHPNSTTRLKGVGAD